MRRLLALLIATMWAGLPAAAQTVGDVAAEVELRGYYASGGVDITIDGLEQLVDDHPDLAFVALDETPSGGADLFANRLLEQIGRSTVVVLTADEAGAASAVYDDEALDRAFDAAFSTTGDTYLRDFVEVAEALGDGSAPPSATVPDDDPPGGDVSAGGSGLVWILVIGALGYLALRMWRNSREDDAAVGRRFEEARAEITAQMAAVANDILELSDPVELAENAEATAHYRRAAEVYRSAEDRLEGATSTSSFAELADDLDDARWELAAAEALIEGRAVPDRPDEGSPEPCFFDPTHGAGTEDAELRTAAGTRRVRVCRADAERLRAGEHPDPRAVSVDGRNVPAPAAPRSHGGGGIDALDVFSILVGGMGDAARYRWGRRGGSFPGFGGGFGGASRGRSMGSASRPRVADAIRTIGRARRGR